MSSSNSVRVDSQLFAAAREQGKVMSRSAAQQLEHWARLGAALEATGLSVSQMADLIGQRDVAGVSTARVPEAEIWAYKRAKQARDLDDVRSGRLGNDQMSWFSGGKARSARLVNSPY